MIANVNVNQFSKPNLAPRTRKSCSGGHVRACNMIPCLGSITYDQSPPQSEPNKLQWTPPASIVEPLKAAITTTT